MKSLRTSFILYAVLLISSALHAATNISGTYSADDTLDLAGSPYIVTGNVTVSCGVILTILPGVEVKFEPARRLYIYGTLNATGATFTSNNPSPSAGDWDFIEINGTSSCPAEANFTGCLISYGNYIHIYDYATLNVDNSTISEFSNNGVYVHNSPMAAANITNNSSITNCATGAQLHGGVFYIDSSNISGSGGWPVKIMGENADFQPTNSADFTGNQNDGIYIGFVSIYGSFHFPYTNVPYWLYNFLTIYGELTIADNVIVKAASDINVRGKLKAAASPGNWIYFTSQKDDNWGGDTNGDGVLTAPNYGDWKGITFHSNSIDTANVLKRVKIRYAGQSGFRGGVDCDGSSPLIDSCEFQINIYGVTFRNGSQATFTNNTIGSSDITPVAMTMDADPVFSNNSFSFSDNDYDAIGIFGGTMTRSSTLIKRNFTTVPNVTYLLLGEVIIPAGDTLTIEPGIVLKFLYSSADIRIRVEGTLIANGTNTEPIVFTSVRDDNHGNPNDTNKDGNITNPTNTDWDGIVFSPTSSGSLNYCQLYYADIDNNDYLYSAYRDGAIAIIHTNIDINHCEIKDVVNGIMVYGASQPAITNTQFINNSGIPVAISMSADPVFSGNSFTNVGTIGLGLIGETVTSNGTVKKRNLAGYTNITYVLLSDITIANGTYVSIDPGIVIKGSPAAGIAVEGGLAINGNAIEPVYFTSIKDDNLGNPFDTNGDGNSTSPSGGDWSNISYLSSSDDAYNLIKYATLKYGSVGTYVETGYGSINTYGLISFRNAGGTVQNTTVDNSNQYGLEFSGNSNPVIENVTIQNCSRDPVYMSLHADPTFNNVQFIANNSNGIRIIEGTLSSDATLKKRSIAGFSNVGYIIGQLSIGTSAILTVEKGVVLKMETSSSNIRVHGGLKLIGTPGENIFITSLKDDSIGGDTNNDGNSSSPNEQDWGSVIFESTAIDTASVLKHCQLKYGGYFWVEQSPLTVKSAYLRIDSCNIEFSDYYGIKITGNANPEVSNCQFSNIASTPVALSMFSSPVFSNNTALNIGYMAIGVLGETWSQDDTVPARNFAGYFPVNYFLLDNITINTGTEITIPEGLTFKRIGSSSFTVNGKINVLGTSSEPVVFTEYRDDMYGNPPDMNQDGNASSASSMSGYWFSFNDVSDDSSKIQYAIFRWSDAGIHCQSASPMIENCTFDASKYGLTLTGVSSPVVNTNTFHNLVESPMLTSILSYPASTMNNVISGSTPGGIFILSETLNQDVTLPRRDFGGVTNIPYIFSTFTIGTGATLTLEPGLVLKFKDNGYITVRKGLMATGGNGADSTIVFTSIKDDFFGGDTNADSTATSPSTNSWYGIRIENEAIDPLCQFKHCIFRFAGNGSTYGAITTTSASPLVLNSIFDNCYNGVVAKSASNPVVNYCDFVNIPNYAILNVNQSFIIDAENCWWGSASGPTHSSNPGGTGTTVSDAVDFIPWIGSGAINPLMGDVSLNNLIQAYDASLVLQHVVSPFLNPTQQSVADVSGNGAITAYDASLILQYVVGLINYFPAELMKTGAPVYRQDNTALVISSVEGAPDEELLIDIGVINADDLYSMDIVLNYDPMLLEILGVNLSAGGMQTAVDYTQPGVIRIAIAGPAPLNHDGTIGSLKVKVIGNPEVNFIPVNIQTFLANEIDRRAISQNGGVQLPGIISGVANPQSGSLQQPYPNPSSGQITIPFMVNKEHARITVAVYNIAGKQVRLLADGNFNPGLHHIYWNGDDDLGNKLPAGMYFIHLRSDHNTGVQQIFIKQ